MVVGREDVSASSCRSDGMFGMYVQMNVRCVTEMTSMSTYRRLLQLQLYLHKRCRLFLIVPTAIFHYPTREEAYERMYEVCVYVCMHMYKYVTMKAYYRDVVIEVSSLLQS